MTKIKSIFILIIILIFSLIACSKETTSIEPISKSEILMGTVITVTLYDNDNTEILDNIFEKIKQLEGAFSINDAGTEVDKINAMAGIEPVKVSKDTFNLIKEGLYFSDISKGSFDITVGPLVKLWSIGLPEAKVPTQEEIDTVLPLINYNDVILNDTEETVFLSKANMMLDLGGIAKGYTADLISSMLTDSNVNSAIIDLGGNIFAHGFKNEKENWRIGVQNPFSDRGNIIGVLSLSNKSVVTSGIYERYLEQDGIKYHHILDPKTGYPYENEIAGVTIISDKSSIGDALSTATFAMGIEKGLSFIESLEGVDAIFITKDNSVYVTSGVKDIFELSNSEFKIVN